MKPVIRPTLDTHLHLVMSCCHVLFILTAGKQGECIVFEPFAIVLLLYCRTLSKSFYSESYFCDLSHLEQNLSCPIMSHQMLTQLADVSEQI